MPFDLTYSSPMKSENTIDFAWEYRDNGAVTASTLDISRYATDKLRNAIDALGIPGITGSGYRTSVYINGKLTYDLSFEVHSPYRTSLYLSDTSPRVGRSATGHISVEPGDIYFDFSVSFRLSFIIGAKVFLSGMQVAGGDYPIETPTFSRSGRIYTDYESPLGTYRVSIKQELEKVMGKVNLPKVQFALGVGLHSVVVAIPFDWDLEFVFKSYIDAYPSTGHILSVSPTVATFGRTAALPFTIVPQLGGQDSVKWSFSQRMSMEAHFLAKAKFIADAAAYGVVFFSYETPQYDIVHFSGELVTLTKKSQSVLSSQLSVPYPKLTTTIMSVDCRVKDTTLKLSVNDETGASISGARVDVTTSKRSYPAKDLGKGYYSATVPTSELSSIQVSASKSGCEGCLTRMDIGTSYLQEYNALQSKFTTLQSAHGSLKSQYDSLQTKYMSIESEQRTRSALFESVQSEHESLKSQHASLLSNHTILESKYNELESKYKELQMRTSPLVSPLEHVEQIAEESKELISRTPIVGEFATLLDRIVPGYGELAFVAVCIASIAAAIILIKRRGQ